MGKKKVEPEEKATEEKVEEKPEEEKEDPPVVKELKAIDDKYLAIEREYEKEVQELQKKYTAKQQPLLDQRREILAKADSNQAEKTGTPALSGFWLQAMKHLPALEDQIEEWDEPVLEYLSDVQKSFLDEGDLQKGFKLTFHFVENPYFTNDVLWKEYYTKESNPYTGEVDTEEIKACSIDWKPGKNVTVETIKKKVKGGGAKKAKAKGKEKEEARDSFFRHFFRNLKPGMEIPDDINLDEAREMCGEDDEEDDEQMLGFIMENDYEIGCSVRDHLVPYAVRWYTGEACPDEDYDEDEEEEDDEDDEEEDDDDDDDDDEEEEEDHRKGKKGAPPPKKRGSGDKKAVAPGADGKKAEECKQQ